MRRLSLTGPKALRILYLVDVLLLNGAFFISVWIKRKQIVLTPEYTELLLAFNLLWAVGCGLAKKIRLSRPASFVEHFLPMVRAFIYFALLVFFTLFVFDLFFYSRMIVLLTLGLHFLFSFGLGAVLYLSLWGPNAEFVEFEELALLPPTPADRKDFESVDRSSGPCGSP